MNLKGTKTEKNLLIAFAGETQARNRYTYFASEARKAGLEYIAAIFLETAENEKEHAKVFFQHLAAGGGDLAEIAKVEKFHESRYRALIDHVQNGTFFKRPDTVKWHCRNRGYVVPGHHPPDLCPSCKHPKSYYEVLAENYP